MYNQRRKIYEIERYFVKLREELEEELREAITSDKDTNILIGFSSLMKPVAFSLNTTTIYNDYYDDIIYTVHNSDISVMDYFNNDLETISEITNISIKDMKEYTARMMGKNIYEVDNDDIIIAIDTPVVHDKLLARRKEIIEETCDFKTMANNILSTYLEFLRVNYKEVEFI